MMDDRTADDRTAAKDSLHLSQLMSDDYVNGFCFKARIHPLKYMDYGM